MRQTRCQKANTLSTLWNNLCRFAGPLVLTGLLICNGGNNAFARDNGDPIILASLNPTIKQTQPSVHLNLFGAGEQQFSDLSAFTKWDSVLKRFDRTFKSSMTKPYVQNWLSMLAGLENASPEKKMAAVNAYMNKVRFIADIDNYGTRDYWATPMEFLKNGGDCEDYAFAKYVSLQALGFNKNDMRLAIVYDQVMQMPHAVLIVYTDGQAKVMDNQNPAILESAEISRYKPIYSISEVAWWRH